MDERERDEKDRTRTIRTTAKRAKSVLELIKKNTDLKWFYFGRLKSGSQDADARIHDTLSNCKGGDTSVVLLELLRLQAKKEIFNGLMTDPDGCIEAEKNRDKQLKKMKEQEE